MDLPGQLRMDRARHLHNDRQLTNTKSVPATTPKQVGDRPKAHRYLLAFDLNGNLT